MQAGVRCLRLQCLDRRTKQLPKIVDHASRKKKIIAEASRLIAEHGYDQLTIRGLAHAMDISTGAITHYYASKDDILLSALQSVHERFYARASKAIGKKQGVSALRARMRASIPLTPSVRRDWAIMFQFWASATRKRNFGRYMSEEHKRLQALDMLHLEYARSHDEISPDLRLRNVAEQLDSMTTGIGVSSTFNATRLNKNHTFQIIDDALLQLAKK